MDSTILEIRKWLSFVTDIPVDRVHYATVPGPRSGGPCKLPAPYIWMLRTDTVVEECLENQNHPLLVELGIEIADESDAEIFDVEIWSADASKVDSLAQQLRNATPTQSPSLQSIAATNQADDYFARGANQIYVHAGAFAAALQLEVTRRPTA